MKNAAQNAASKLVKLYVWSECPYCHRAELAATERGVPFEKVEVPLDMPDWYKKINPMETVPTLEIGEGQYVYESNLVAQYFDNMGSPSGKLMGTTPYQRHRIEFFMSQVGDMISACYGLVRDPHNTEKRKALDDNVAYIDNIVAESQVTGGPYILDDQFSMADVSVIPFLIRFSAVLSYYAAFDLLAKGPHLKRLLGAARQRRSVVTTTFDNNRYIRFYERFVPAEMFIRGAKFGPVLFGNSFCPFVDRARLACLLKGFEPYYVDIDLGNKPDYYKYVNFRETVPTLLTANGEYIHESQLIANYIDQTVEGGAQLVPRGDANKEYAVSYLVTYAGYFISALYGLAANPTDPSAKEELVWAIKELQKQLEKKPFGQGPFFGGATWNAGDVALMPFVVRLKANTPELTNGYDAFAEFPFLEAYVKAGLESKEGKAVFKPLPEYVARSKARLAKK